MKKSTPTSFGYVKIQVEMAVKPGHLVSKGFRARTDDGFANS